MAASYINEHSLEYYIVLYLKNELEKHFKYVAPVFPWLKRETSSISKVLHFKDEFQLLLVFPRRPKLDINTKRIFITINQELIEFRDFVSQHDIPVILGCPIAFNFWELSQCSKYVWAEINNQQISTYLNLIYCTDLNETILPSISINDIVKLIQKSRLINIDSFTELINESKYILPKRFLFGPLYKPVYFLIKDMEN